MGADDTISLDSGVELRDEIEQFDMAAYAAALAFNSAALPPNMPEWLKAAIEAKADELRSDPDNPLIAGHASVRDAKRKRADDDSDELRSQLGQLAQQREEWARTEHSFAGVKMTGEEWGELASDLKRDGPLRDWLIQRLMRDGQTKAQAEQKAAEFADIATIMSKPESERTAAEREKMDRAESDPTFKKVMPELQDQQRSIAAGYGVRDSLSTDQKTSVDKGGDVFASAPDLTAEHRLAVAAIEPMTPKLPNKSAPTMPAAPAPAAAGLEI